MGNFFVSAFLVLATLAFPGGFQKSLCQGEVNQPKDFISWDDLKVNEQMARLSSGDSFNESRVIVVDKNGGGDSVTVQGAVNMVPNNNKQRVKIFILPGIYREKVIVPNLKPYISFIGNENKVFETIISWNNKASDKDSNGAQLGTYKSASVTIESDYFAATGITFENTIVADNKGLGMQAVALRLSGDKALLYKIRVVGTQDTLLDESGSHYFYQSYIQGSIDFIFGRARSLYQGCILHSTAKRSGAIAAHHRDSADENTGFSFVDSEISGTGKIYLGRAWGNYSRVVYANCYIDDIINPQGWSDWNNPSRQKTTVFGEYGCTGGGADRRYRVPWSKNLTYNEVKPFLDTKFIDGGMWLRL